MNMKPRIVNNQRVLKYTPEDWDSRLLAMGMPKDVRKKPKWFNLKLWLENRTRNQNKNAIIMFIGSVGNGKSWAALSLMEDLLGPGFDVKERVGFEVVDIAQKIKKYGKGEVILWDEAGVDFGSRDWMSKENKKIGKIFQVMRKRNQILLMTVPVMKMIDKQGRQIAHMIVNPLKLDRRSQVNWCLTKFLQTNSYSGITYQHYPLGWKWFMFGFPRPSRCVTDVYEEISSEFKNRQLDEIIGKKEETKKEEFDIMKIGKRILNNKEKYSWILTKDGKLSKYRAMTKFNIGRRRAQQLKEVVDSPPASI